jgi:hypothetical protein
MRLKRKPPGHRRTHRRRTDLEPFVSTFGPLPTLVERGEFDDLGVVEEVVDGYHSVAALRVTALPVYAGDAWSRGLLWQEWAQELLRRQAQCLVALHPSLLGAESPNPTLRTLDLRYLAGGERGAVELALLLKAFDPDAQRSRWWAKALADEVSALFPAEYGLRPVASEGALTRYALRLDEFTDGTEAEEFGPGWWLGEIRRYEEFVPLDRERQVREQNYLVYPVTWRLAGMSQVLTLLHSWPGQAVVSVALRPTALYEAEERHLCDLHVTFEKLEEADWLKARVQAQIGQRVYASYLRCLKRPYLMRVRFAGRGSEPEALVRALGATLSAVPESAPNPLLAADLPHMPFDAGYEVVFPRRAVQDELETAWRNLLWLEFDDWGPELSLPIYRRFRYLVDAWGANSAFRLPVLPPDLVVELGLSQA